MDETDDAQVADVVISNKDVYLVDSDGNKVGDGATLNFMENLPIASETTIGGIKVGSGLAVDSNGVLSAKTTASEDSLTLISPSGYTFIITVQDDGTLTSTRLMHYGNIIATNALQIIEGESGTILVKLDTKPDETQNVSISTDDEYVTFNPNILSFTPENYNTQQTITVNVTSDGNYKSRSIIIALSSPNVNNVNIPLTIINSEEDPNAGVNIFEASHLEGKATLNEQTKEISGAARWDYFAYIPVEANSEYDVSFETDRRIMVHLVGEDKTTAVDGVNFDTGAQSQGVFKMFETVITTNETPGYIRLRLAEESYVTFMRNLQVVKR